MSLSSNFKFIVATLTLSMAVGPSYIIRTENTVTHLDGATLVVLGLTIYCFVLAKKISTNLKRIRGRVVAFPYESDTTYDGVWIAAIPCCLHYKTTGPVIQRLDKQWLPSWEFSWGMSPSLLAAIALLVITPFLYKLSRGISATQPAA